MKIPSSIRIALLSALAYLTIPPWTTAQAQTIYAFWSFDEYTSGNGAFEIGVTAETWTGTPSVTYAGSTLLNGGGAASFTAYNGTTWLGSGTGSLPGHSLAWSSGSTGNSFSLFLDMTDSEALQVRMDIRSFTGGPAAFTDLQYKIGEGEFVSSGISLGAITTGTSYSAWNVDLTSLIAINNQPDVTLRWLIPDIASGTSLRIDNLQISAGVIPEPATGGLILGFCICALLTRRWLCRCSN